MILLMAGGINWGLVGAFDYNVVSEIFGSGSNAATVLYVLAGLAGVYNLAGRLGIVDDED